MKKKFTFISFIIVVLLITAPFSGCKKKKVELTPGERGTDKEIYEKARKQMKRAPEKARLLFKEIMHLYPDSIYARRSKIGIADTYFRQKDSSSLIMAATEYQEFVNLYPNSPDAVYAKLQIALCYYRQVRKAGRDQSNSHLALKALESMVKQYPDTKEAEEAKKMIAKTRQTLARHYFIIGVSNYQLKAYKGGVTRFKQVIDEFPDFKEQDKLFYYTGKCYYAMKDYASAISFFQKIVSSFPKSKYLKKSTVMIKDIAQLQANGNQSSKPDGPKKVEKKKIQ
ncbi:MAG: outer membrane protein assembly factor BamD [bacterium]|nr:outer membrane protein assembly factor BamD [bacterium]